MSVASNSHPGPGLVVRHLLLCALPVLGGCASLGEALQVSEVKPWERDILARENMQLVPDSLETSVDEHLYFSKEGSTGGRSVQGGGCGCN